MYDLNGVKPVISVSRNYPFKDNFTHVLGYVSQANEKDIEAMKDLTLKTNSILVSLFDSADLILV